MWARSEIFGVLGPLEMDGAARICLGVLLGVNGVLQARVAVITVDHSYRSSTAVSHTAHSYTFYIVVTTSTDRNYRFFAAAT